MRPFVLLLLVSLTCLVSAKKPNIIFILADDTSWRDINYGDEWDNLTPHLGKMKDEGLELPKVYTQSKCTPSRAALMTGRYPFKIGLQTNKVFSRFKNNTLNPNDKLLPAFLKEQGYMNHMVGKWHLGNCNFQATPLAKGFDTFFGSWANVQDHYTHMAGDFYDWHWNNDTYWEGKGTYDTHLITSHTQYLLKEHYENPTTADQPLFIYVAYLAPHKPGQAPESYIKDTKCAEINYPGDAKLTKKRQIFCGMMAALDEGVGNITKTLKELGVIDDFIIIFTSDNGAAIENGASSWPLRGNKETVYEGATRVRALLRAPKFLKHPTGQYDGRIHMTDILPTLYEAAGGDPTTLPDTIDGTSAWQALKQGKPKNPKWMVYNIDSKRNLGAIGLKNETHDFKLVYIKEGSVTGWRSPRTKAQKKQDKKQKITGRVKTNGNYYRLFNLATNPNEREPSKEFPDAALQYPAVFQEMKAKLKEFMDLEVPVPKYSQLPRDYPGHPKYNEGAWGFGGC